MNSIRRCTEQDFSVIAEIINDGAQSYAGVVPGDRLKTPYMSDDELHHEIAQGVTFWGYEKSGMLLGVMGIQPVQNVTLIRHAYVRTENQSLGIGAQLLAHLRGLARGPILIGTWAASTGAIRFYQRHGFHLVNPEEKTACCESTGLCRIAKSTHPLF